MPAFEQKEATPEIQFVIRESPTGPNPFDIGFKYILQQKWKVTRGGTGDGVKESYEWRDVPKVRETDNG